MGLFSQDKKTTKTTLNQQNEQSPTTASGESSVAARGGINIRNDDLGEGASQSNIRLGKGAKLVINQNSDPGLLAKLLDQQQSSLQDYLSNANFTSQAQADNLNSVLSKIGDLAESKQTGGESNRDKTILYIVLAGAAAVAAIFGKGRWGLFIAIGAAAYFIFGGKEEPQST